MKKLYFAAQKYLLKDTRYFFLYLFRYFQRNYRHACIFLNEESFVDQIKRGKSIIRFGDGEIDLLHFLSLPRYQKYSNSIRKDLLAMIRGYTEQSQYIIMIPLFVNYTNKEISNIGRFTCWMPLKLSYEMFFNKKAAYFDQHIFYKDNKFEKLILPYLKTKKLIVVTNEKNKSFLETTDLNKLVIDYILSPAQDAYESRDMLQQQITEAVERSDFSKQDIVIIMSAGLSKTIIYNLSQKGYQLLDIGKGLESYYKGESIQHLI